MIDFSLHQQLLQTNTSSDTTSTPKEHGKQYNPYMNNEGTVFGFKGKDFIMLTGDTRLSSGYSIISRESPKLFKLTEKVFLASSGMYADILSLYKNLKIRVELYKTATKYEPTVESIAQLLSTTLYGRRFFPYYTFNILAGVNNNGEFKLYGYDAVGSFDSLDYVANGSGKEQILPILDSLLKHGYDHVDAAVGESLAKTAMNCCSNRDIYTGDKMDLVILYRDGTFESKQFELRKD